MWSWVTIGIGPLNYGFIVRKDLVEVQRFWDQIVPLAGSRIVVGFFFLWMSILNISLECSIKLGALLFSFSTTCFSFLQQQQSPAKSEYLHLLVCFGEKSHHYLCRNWQLFSLESKNPAPPLLFNKIALPWFLHLFCGVSVLLHSASLRCFSRETSKIIIH